MLSLLPRLKKLVVEGIPGRSQDSGIGTDHRRPEIIRRTSELLAASVLEILLDVKPKADFRLLLKRRREPTSMSSVELSPVRSSLP